jgi:hypothetical protein
MVQDGARPERLEQRPIVSLVDQHGQHLHDEEEKHGRQGIPLPQAPGMGNFVTRVTIQQNLCATHGEQSCYPVKPSPIKTKVLQDLDQEGPSDEIKSPCNVDFQQEARPFP